MTPSDQHLEQLARAVIDSTNEHGQPYEGHHDARLALGSPEAAEAILSLLARLRAAEERVRELEAELHEWHESALEQSEYE